MDISYKEVYTMNKEEARRLIIDTYSTIGNLSHTARLWHTSRHVVRKWVRRHQEEGNPKIAIEISGTILRVQKHPPGVFFGSSPPLQ